MNKRTILSITILITVLLLAACSAGESTDVPAGEEGNDAESPETWRRQFEGEIGLQMQLSLGTFVLEDTDLTVTPEQAAELLPLWKAVRSLSESDTAARAEIDAVIGQIQDTMTPEQLDFIAETDLTPEAMNALIEKYDLKPENMPEDDSGEFQAFPGGGGEFPGGGPGGAPGGDPGGGPGMGQDPGAGMFNGDIDPETMATMEARRAERGAGFGIRMGSFWIDPLIELLEARAGS